MLIIIINYQRTDLHIKQSRNLPGESEQTDFPSSIGV